MESPLSILEESILKSKIKQEESKKNEESHIAEPISFWTLIYMTAQIKTVAGGVCCRKPLLLLRRKSNMMKWRLKKESATAFLFKLKIVIPRLFIDDAQRRSCENNDEKWKFFQQYFHCKLCCCCGGSAVVSVTTWTWLTLFFIARAWVYTSGNDQKSEKFDTFQ